MLKNLSDFLGKTAKYHKFFFNQELYHEVPHKYCDTNASYLILLFYYNFIIINILLR